MGEQRAVRVAVAAFLGLSLAFVTVATVRYTLPSENVDLLQANGELTAAQKAQLELIDAAEYRLRIKMANNHYESVLNAVGPGMESGAAAPSRHGDVRVGHGTFDTNQVLHPPLYMEVTKGVVRNKIDTAAEKSEKLVHAATEGAEKDVARRAGRFVGFKHTVHTVRDGTGGTVSFAVAPVEALASTTGQANQKDSSDHPAPAQTKSLNKSTKPPALSATSQQRSLPAISTHGSQSGRSFSSFPGRQDEGSASHIAATVYQQHSGGVHQAPKALAADKEPRQAASLHRASAGHSELGSSVTTTWSKAKQEKETGTSLTISPAQVMQARHIHPVVRPDSSAPVNVVPRPVRGKLAAGSHRAIAERQDALTTADTSSDVSADSAPGELQDDSDSTVTRVTKAAAASESSESHDSSKGTGVAQAHAATESAKSVHGSTKVAVATHVAAVSAPAHENSKITGVAEARAASASALAGSARAQDSGVSQANAASASAHDSSVPQAAAASASAKSAHNSTKVRLEMTKNIPAHASKAASDSGHSSSAIGGASASTGGASEVAVAKTTPPIRHHKAGTDTNGGTPLAVIDRALSHDAEGSKATVTSASSAQTHKTTLKPAASHSVSAAAHTAPKAVSHGEINPLSEIDQAIKSDEHRSQRVDPAKQPVPDKHTPRAKAEAKPKVEQPQIRTHEIHPLKVIDAAYAKEIEKSQAAAEAERQQTKSVARETAAQVRHPVRKGQAQASTALPSKGSKGKVVKHAVSKPKPVSAPKPEVNPLDIISKALTAEEKEKEKEKVHRPAKAAAPSKSSATKDKKRGSLDRVFGSAIAKKVAAMFDKMHKSPAAAAIERNSPKVVDPTASSKPTVVASAVGAAGDEEARGAQSAGTEKGKRDWGLLGKEEGADGGLLEGKEDEEALSDLHKLEERGLLKKSSEQEDAGSGIWEPPQASQAPAHRGTQDEAADSEDEMADIAGVKPLPKSLVEVPHWYSTRR